MPRRYDESELDYYHGANPTVHYFGRTMEVRVNAIRRLSQHSANFAQGENARHLLVELFGFADWSSLRKAHAHGDSISVWLDSKLRLLGSEHGYAIYKAMLARKTDE